MSSGVDRKSGNGNMYTSNPYGGPTFLSAPGSVTEGWGGGFGLPFGGSGSGSSAGIGALAADPSLGTGVGPGLSSIVGADASTGLPAWLRAAIGLGGPLAVRSLTGGGGSSPGGSGALDPGMQAQLAALFALMNRRLASQEPVHDAAMRLALTMGQSGPNPRLPDAMAAAQTPRPRTTLSPDVLQAVQALMARIPRG